MKCLKCNHDLEKVDRELVRSLGLPPYRHSHDHLFACFDENFNVLAHEPTLPAHRRAAQPEGE